MPETFFAHGRCLALAAALAFAPALVRADHPAPTLGLGYAGPIQTLSAYTLERGQTAFGARVGYDRFEAFSDARLRAIGAQGEEAHSLDTVTTYSAFFAYGLNDRVTLIAVLPYLDAQNLREADNEGGAGAVHLHGDARGLGDATFLAQALLTPPGGKEALALLAGIKAPTGVTDARDIEGRLFDAEAQPGSGSWDPLLGIAFSRPLGGVRFDTDLLYTFATEGKAETNRGDRLRYNAALSRRLGGADPDHRHVGHGHIDAVVELNAEWAEATTIAGAEDPNSGGHRLFISPGLRYASADGWVAFASLGLPVRQRLHGLQTQTDYRLLIGISYVGS